MFRIGAKAMTSEHATIPNELPRGARVRLRYGPPQDGVREVEVVLGT